MPRVRSFLILAAALPVAALGQQAAVASADAILSNEPSPPMVSAAGDTVAWSTYDASVRSWFLVTRRAGVQERATVAPRSVPFDVDLGFDGAGRLVAAYSRCRVDPGGASTKGSGCDLYTYDLAAKTESRLAGASTGESSETLPTLAGGRVAFARVYEQRSGTSGTKSYLYVRSLAGGSSTRLPGGSDNGDPRTGPTAMDLAGGRLAFGWDLVGSSRNCAYGCSELRVDTLAGAKTIVEQASNGNLSGAYLMTPALIGTTVLYGRSTVGESDFAAQHQFRSLSLVGGVRGAASAPYRMAGTSTGPSDVIAVQCPPVPDPGGPASCQVLLLGPVRYADPDTQLSTSSSLSPVSAYSANLAYSVRDPDGAYGLVIRDRKGVLSRPAVAPRSVPFDVDLGPAADGGLVAAYSRCATEPRATGLDGLPVWSTGRGCDLYRYDVGKGRETRIAGASTSGSSEFLPSVWKDEVAFARVYESRPGGDGTLPYLYVRPLSGSGGSTRLPGGPRGVDGLPGPQALDHSGTRIAFVWDDRPSLTSHRSQLRLDTQGAGHLVVDGVTSADGGARLRSPFMDGGQLWWTARDATDLASGAGASSVGQYGLADGARRTSLAPDPLVAYGVSRSTSANFTLTYYARRSGAGMTFSSPAWPLARTLPAG